MMMGLLHILRVDRELVHPFCRVNLGEDCEARGGSFSQKIE
jgi:hypothetical protein